jgi:uncharacterized protein (DUF1778 family)
MFHMTKDTHIGLRLPAAQAEALTTAAAATGRSRSDVVRRLVASYLQVLDAADNEED